MSRAPMHHKSVPKVNVGEEAFLTWIKRLGLPTPERNFAFSSERKFQIDFAWPEVRLGCEIDGGIWRQNGGAHTGTGHIRDIEKGNLLLDMGWAVYHFIPQQARNGNAALKMQMAIAQRTTAIKD